MSWIAAAIGATAVVGLYSANKSANAADKAANSADAAAQLQYDISQQQLDLGKEQWQTYRDKILPIELEAQQLGVDAQELAYRRGEEDFRLYQDYYAPLQESFVQDAQEGIQPQYDRVARDARIGVDQAFDSAEASNQRDLERRGVRPGSGASSQGDTSLARAATQALGVRQAVEGERDRVETENFNRKAVALGRQPTAASPIQSSTPGVTPAGATSAYGAAGNTAYGAGSQQAYMANAYGNAAGGAAQAAFQIPMQAMDLYSRFQQPATTAPAYTGGGSAGGFGSSAIQPGSGSFWDTGSGTSTMAFAEGGQVPQLSRGEPQRPSPAGRVVGPPGRDQVPAYIEGPGGQQQPAALTGGEVVIPREVVLQKGTEFFDKLLEGGKQRRAEREKPRHALGRMH